MVRCPSYPSLAQDKPYQVYAEKGLFLLVTPTGGRPWASKLISLGICPDVKLKDATDRRDGFDAEFGVSHYITVITNLGVSQL